MKTKVPTKEISADELPNATQLAMIAATLATIPEHRGKQPRELVEIAMDLWEAAHQMVAIQDLK